MVGHYPQEEAIDSIDPSFSGSLSCPRSFAEKGEAMEAAAASASSAKPRREPPPIPPNYVSLQRLQELRLKEKAEEEEKRRREEEEAAAAAKRAAALKAAEEAALAAAVKREAALKAETKGRAVSREAFNERHRGGRAQGQGHQWVAVAHRAPVPTPACEEVAAGKKERMARGNRGEEGPDDVASNAPHPHGGCKSQWKGKGKKKKKKKASSCNTVGDPGNLAEEAAAPAASNGGKPENKSESKAMGNAAVAPLDPGKAAVASSPGHLTCKGRKGAGGRSAEKIPGDAPAKTACPSPPPRGVKSGNTGKPKPAAPGLADAGTGGDYPADPAQAPPTSPADGSSKPKSGGPLRKTVAANAEGLVEGQRRQPPRVARRSAEHWRGRGDGPAEPHGRVWVPKAAAAAVVGSSAGGGAGIGDK